MQDPTIEGLKAIPKLIKMAFAGQSVRNDVIDRANELATSIVTASGFTASRLNRALVAKTKKERIDILTGLAQGDIEQFSRMNGHCAMIYSASNALSRWTSNEAVNVRLSTKARAIEVINKLQDAEHGMQVMFNELLAMPGNMSKMKDEQIKQWLREALGRTLDLSNAATSSVRELSALV